MKGLATCALITLAACAIDQIGDETTPSGEMPPVQPTVTTPAAEDVHCTDKPDVGPATGWHHLSSRLVEELGSPYHRGHDLVATTADATQTITAKITYGPSDKDLEDEDIDVFACMSKGWSKLGTARTNDDGIFTLQLAGSERLPAGLRDLYLSVAGDRTGAAFLALVAAPGSPVIVSDVDGTLTASENAYPISLATGDDVPAQPDAPAALSSAASRGVNIVYISARGDRFTQDTRDWLAAKGFPRGIVKLPPSIITLPGEDTITAKTELLTTLDGLDLLAGIGNRKTDVAAYGDVGLPPDRIFIKLPEFTSELTADLMENKATSFDLYEMLRTEHLDPMLAH
jgi:phosphatidate phosphatase PAH1